MIRDRDLSCVSNTHKYILPKYPIPPTPELVMSFLARRSFRAVSRSARQIHSATPYRTYLSEQEALQHHASGHIHRPSQYLLY
jgi:hypothetical protein